MRTLNRDCVMQSPTRDEIESAIRRAHQLRSEAVSDGPIWVSAWVRAMINHLLSGISRRIRDIKRLRELMCGDGCRQG